MSEIDHRYLLDSGGHVWLWGERRQAAKVLSTPGVAGESRSVLGNHGRPFEIVGRMGGKPILTATGTSRSSADDALNAVEADIDALVESGQAVAWEDDKGRSGTNLVLTSFIPDNNRQYAEHGDGVKAIEHYTLRGVELSGRTA